MTQVEYNENRMGESVERMLAVKGHTEYGERGKNILCAAVSTLVYTLVFGLMDLEEGCVDCDYCLHPGDAVIRATSKNEEGETACAVLFRAVLHGLDKLEAQYPQYLARRI